MHHLYWVTHRPGLTGPFHIAIPVYGPAFWMHLRYCYVLVAVSAFLLAQAAVQSAGVYRAQAAVMLFAVIVPWIVNIVDMTQYAGLYPRRYRRDDLRGDRPGVLARPVPISTARPDACRVGGRRRRE